MNKTPELLEQAIEKTTEKINKENIKNANNSSLTSEKIKRILCLVEICSTHLEILLGITQNYGGFYSAYPKRCIDEMSLFKTILEMEIKNHED